MDPTESTRFSPQRARDIASTTIATNIWSHKIDITLDNSNTTTTNFTNMSDPHVESYDCTGAVSLNSSMQSNVPSPFGGMHKFTHLNMPGGQWEQGSKWMSHDMHSSHYTNLRRETRKNWFNSGLPVTHDKNPSKCDRDINAPLSSNNGKGSYPNSIFIAHGSSLLAFNNTLQCIYHNNNIASNSIILNKLNNLLINQKKSQHHFQVNRFCSNKVTKTTPTTTDTKHPNEAPSVNIEDPSTKPLSSRETFKRAIKEYGGTVLVFHITMSLASLGICYQLVARYI